MATKQQRRDISKKLEKLERKTKKKRWDKTKVKMVKDEKILDKAKIKELKEKTY